MTHLYDVKMNQWVRLIIHINFMTLLFYRRDVNSQPVAKEIDILKKNSVKKTKEEDLDWEEQVSTPLSFLILLNGAAA